MLLLGLFYKRLVELATANCFIRGLSIYLSFTILAFTYARRKKPKYLESQVMKASLIIKADKQIYSFLTIHDNFKMFYKYNFSMLLLGIFYNKQFSCIGDCNLFHKRFIYLPIVYLLLLTGGKRS